MSPLRARRQVGFTLIELTLSLAVLSVLLLSLVGAMFIASTSINVTERAGSSQSNRSAAFESELANDLWLATSFFELEQARVSMSVPDRDGDGTSEVVAYRWDGTPGDPIVRTYNGSPRTVVADVQWFFLATETREITGQANLIPDPDPMAWGYFRTGTNSLRVLLVVANPAALTPQESARRNICQLLGHEVGLISQSASPTDFAIAALSHDVFYVPEETDSTILAPSIVNSPIGIVNEDGPLAIQLGFASSGLYIDGSEVRIVNSSHEITSGLTTGPMSFADAVQPVHVLDTPLGPEVTLLAESDRVQDIPILSLYAPSFMCLDTNEESVLGPVASRRVHLPWGGAGFDVNTLNDNGRDLLRRSLEWAGSGATDWRTFGFDEQFTIEAGQMRHKQFATQVALSEPGMMSSISAYIKGAGQDTRFAIYSDSGGEPDALLAQTVVGTTGSDVAWITLPAESPVSLVAGTYWLAVAMVSNTQRYHHGGGADPGQLRIKANNAVANGFLPTWGTSDDVFALKVSVHATYQPD